MALSASSNGPAALMASELMARGRKSAAALEALLQSASTASAPAQQDGIRELAEQILCCLDRALAALHSEGVINDATGGCPTRTPPDAGAQSRPKRRSRVIGVETPTRVEKVSTPDDGLLWRKYGQKDILNSKYPRCTYKYDNGCKATRQVQQSEDDSSAYIVTYFGEHTCGMHAAATASGGGDRKSPQLVINFGSGTTSSGSPWLSSSDDDVGSNSSQFAQAVAQPAEPSSSFDVSCASPDLDSLLHYFDWDSCGDSLFDMEFINFDEAGVFQ